MTQKSRGNTLSSLQSDLDESKEYPFEIQSPLTDSSKFSKQSTDSFVRSFNSQYWINLMANSTIKDADKFKIQNSLRQGIPSQLRPRIWLWMTDYNKSKQFIKNFYNEHKDKQSDYDDQIWKDIDRTYQMDAFFQDPKIKQSMFNVLKLYTFYDYEVGYLQGINYPVACLLYTFHTSNYDDIEFSFGKDIEDDETEKLVFYIFSFICNILNQREIFVRGFPKARQLIQTLTKRVEKEVPEILSKFEGSIADFEVCILPFFFTFCLQFAPLEFASRMMDMIILNGEKFILDLLLRLFVLNKETILEFQDDFEFMNYLKFDMLKETFDQYKNELYTLIPQPQSE